MFQTLHSYVRRSSPLTDAFVRKSIEADAWCSTAIWYIHIIYTYSRNLHTKLLFYFISFLLTDCLERACALKRFTDSYIYYTEIFDSPTERRKTERRMTERRMTERRMGPKAEKGPNIEWPNAEWPNAERYWTSKDWTSNLNAERLNAKKHFIPSMKDS